MQLLKVRLLLLHAPQRNLKKHHLQFLKEDVKNTNKKYKLSIVEQEEQSARFHQSEEERKKRLEELRDRLTFD